MTIAPDPGGRTAPGARDDTEWLRLAVALAVENVATGGGPFGALVVRDGVLLAQGVNQVTPTLDPTAHAEVVAIRRACHATGDFALTGATLYASCEPCPLCLAAILWARVDRVVFTATSDDAVAAGFDDRRFSELFAIPPADWPTPVTRVVVPTSREPFEAWDAKPDKVRY
jgi:tRNA(Arg) A34 adenosine deaminase TadA